MDFLNVLANRRSIYDLKKDAPLNEEQVVEIIEECLKLTPAAFNLPTSRVVVLFGEKHQKLWETAAAALEKTIAKLRPEAYELVLAKIEVFKNAMGSVLFYEDHGFIDELKESYAMYADSFDSWSKEHMGMIQFNIWTALAEAGMGVNLQHYNNLIEKDLAEELGLPEDLRLISQMVFGGIAKSADEKIIDDVKERITVYK